MNCERRSSPLVRVGLVGVLLLAAALNPGDLRAGTRLPSAEQDSALVASLTADPSTVSAGQSVGFQWTVGGPSFTPVSVLTTATIDFGDGETYYGGSGTGYLLTGVTAHAYADSGSYSAVLKGVTEDGEVATSTATVSVRSGSRLATVQLQALPASPAVGQSVSFAFSISGPPGAAATISYGDGTVEPLSGLSGTASHAYSSAGTYAALITATDGNGQAVGAASTAIEVGATTGPG